MKLKSVFEGPTGSPLLKFFVINHRAENKIRVDTQQKSEAAATPTKIVTPPPLCVHFLTDPEHQAPEHCHIAYHHFDVTYRMVFKKNTVDIKCIFHDFWTHCLWCNIV